MQEQIRANRRKSVWLILAMVTLLVLLGYVGMESRVQGGGPFGVLLALAIFFFQLLVYFFAAESILLSGMGARELDRLESPRLFNVIEEMQIASGLAYMPKVYLLDEASPNAFAIGRKPETSAIAVTTGLMYRLNRDELQGVIAHEIGHLKNHDVRFMTLAGVLIGSIVILSEMFGRAMRSFGTRGSSRSSSRGSGGGHPIFLVLAILLIILAPVLARILYFAASRQREYLADASAAQFTRYPEGLASALLRISRAGVALPTANTVTAPMFIVNPLAAHADGDGWFATHPPTVERVQILRAMGGASVADYERAYEQIRGKHVVGAQTLAAAQPAAIREASAEGPVESKGEAKAAAHRAYGYLEVVCQCGASMRVPETYNENTINCLRCNTRNAIPTVEQRAEVRGERLKQHLAGQNLNNAALEPLQFTRTAMGWQNFRCECGGTVQLSPNFSAPRTFCPKCKRKIQITSVV